MRRGGFQHKIPFCIVLLHRMMFGVSLAQGADHVGSYITADYSVFSLQREKRQIARGCRGAPTDEPATARRHRIGMREIRRLIGRRRLPRASVRDGWNRRLIGDGAARGGSARSRPRRRTGTRPARPSSRRTHAQVACERIAAHHVFVAGCLLARCIGGEHVGRAAGRARLVRIPVALRRRRRLLRIAELPGGQRELQVRLVVRHFSRISRTATIATGTAQNTITISQRRNQRCCLHAIHALL